MKALLFFLTTLSCTTLLATAQINPNNKRVETIVAEASRLSQEAYELGPSKY